MKGIAKDTTPGPDRVVYSDLKSIVDDDTLLSDLVELVNVTLKDCCCCCCYISSEYAKICNPEEKGLKDLYLRHSAKKKKRS